MAILSLLLAIYFIASIFLLPDMPIHVDEPAYTDPAASLFLKHEFSSGAWYAQNIHEFWAGNVPLHQILLSSWYRQFGFSLVSTRAINLIYVVVAMFLLWRGLVQTDWFAFGRWRITLVGTVLGTFSVGLMPFWGRPDGITLLLLCAVFCAWSVRGVETVRLLVLGLLAFLSVWAGLQLAVAVGFFGIVLLAVDFKRQWKTVSALAVGGLCGVVMLVWFYVANGVWNGFLASVMPHMGGNTQGAPPRTWSHRIGFLKDPSYLMVILATVATVVGMFWKWTRNRNPLILRTNLLLLAFSVGLPLVFVGLSVFPTYYSFFAVIPALVTIFYAGSKGLLIPELKWTALSAAALAVIFGAPWSMALAFTHNTDNQTRVFEEFVAKVVKPTDCVLYERPAYYALKQRTPKCYLINWYFPHMKSEEKKNLTLLLLAKDTFDRTSPLLEGNWIQVLEPAAVPNRNLKALSNSDWYRKNPIIELRAYRRQP